jgi:hypothetical protein
MPQAGRRPAANSADANSAAANSADTTLLGSGPAGSGPAGSGPDSERPTRVLPERAPLANPFADVVVDDYLRDAVALVLLLVSFGMPWTHTDSATGKVYVILATLVSVVSLALPYLLRGGVLPSSWGNAEVRVVRLLASLPYLAVVLVTLVIDYVGGGLSGTDGVGVGVAIGLAGALLAAQPRHAESAGPADAVLWRAVAVGLGVVILALSVLSLTLALVDVGSRLEWSGVTLLVLHMAFFVLVPGMAILGLARGDGGWRDALVVLGVVGLLASLWLSGAEGVVGGSWSVRNLGPVVLFWPALGAAAAATSLAQTTRMQPGALRWVTLATRLFLVTVVIAVLGVAQSGVALAGSEIGRGIEITVLVLSLIVLAAALVGRNALRRDPRQGRTVALAAAGLIAVVGLVQAAVMGESEPSLLDQVDVVTISAWLVFAATVIAVLTAPTAIRREFGSVLDDVSAPGNPAPPSAPVAATVPAAPSAPRYTATVASDPTTPLQVLADIAAEHPSLRPYVAANPSAYPELLTWLGQLGDPAVDDALRRRH